MKAIPIKIDLLPNAWKSVGYRRTFTLVFQLMSGTVPANANDINFRAVFTTSGTKSYVASHQGDVFKNCAIDESGKVRVTFINHNLEVGEMYCELSMIWKETTSSVPDVFRFATGVKLVSSGGTDPSELGIDIQLPYVNIGLNKDTMWGELSRDDDSLKIHKSHIPELGIDALRVAVEALGKGLANESEQRAENIETIYDTFKNLATINGKSLLDGGDISLAGSGVVEFWAVESFEDTVQDKTDKSADDDGCFVVYSPVHKAFFLRVPTGFTALYYKTWNGSSQWNRWLDSAGAYRPRANKLYVCVSEDGALYWWNSSELLHLGIRSEELGAIQEEVRQLGVRSEQIETELQNLTEQVTNVEDIISNLATINGKSLLDGGDIVITGDGVMIEPIPEEEIIQLGVSS